MSFQGIYICFKQVHVSALCAGKGSMMRKLYDTMRECFTPIWRLAQICCKQSDTHKLCAHLTQSTLFLWFVRDGSIYVSHTTVAASRVSSRDMECVGTQLNWLYSEIMSGAGVRVPVVTSSFARFQADGCSIVHRRQSWQMLRDQFCGQVLLVHN